MSNDSKAVIIRNTTIVAGTGVSVMGVTVAIMFSTWILSILMVAAGLGMLWVLIKVLKEAVDLAEKGVDVYIRVAQVRRGELPAPKSQKQIATVESTVSDPRVIEMPTTPQQPVLATTSQDCLHLSDQHQPHADTVLSGRGLIVGVSGSGKSNTTAVLCEELARLRVPMILADTENEYTSLCDPQYLPNGVLAGRDTKLCVTVENAKQFGRYLLDRGLQVILNLQSYAMEEAALVMVNIIAGLREWQEERENSVRIPCEFLLEEATTWLPQNIKESPLHGTDALDQLQNAFFNDLVRKGRKRGLGLGIICQKIAEIDKRSLQCDWKWLGRQSELNDLEKYTKMGITAEETLSLANGEGFFFSSRVSKLRVQIRRRYSPHGADTPGLANLRQHQQSRNQFDQHPNFDRNREISEHFMKDFVQPVEPFRNITVLSSTPQKATKKGFSDVPEETRKRIIELYEQGIERTKIQKNLGLNGDEYWMVKEVCNWYDREAVEQA